MIVACIGENSYCETPGNTNDLTLSPRQTALVKGSCSYLSKPIVLVLNEGRPRIIREIEPLASAVVDVLPPGIMVVTLSPCSFPANATSVQNCPTHIRNGSTLSPHTTTNLVRLSKQCRAHTTIMLTSTCSGSFRIRHEPTPPSNIPT